MGQAALTQQVDNIRIKRIDLLKQQLDGDLTTAFDDYAAIYHEFGIDWLRNLAATALPACERGYIYVASLSPAEFVACPVRLNQQTGHLHALSNYYSSLYSPVVRTKQPRTLFTALFRFIAKTEGVNAITLSPFDVESPVYFDIQAALQDAGWKGLHTWSCFANWTHTVLDNSYQTYFSSLPSKVRNTVDRKSRKFLQTGRGELRLVKNSEALPGAIEQFQSVYQRSWKNEEPHPAFIPGLLELAARKGWLRLGIASYDGKPVAAQLWLVNNSTAFIFKLAYDEDYKRLSPGTVLTAYLMERVISVDGVTTIDYLTGDDAYKQDWMSARRERMGIAAYNTGSIKGLAAYTSHRLKGLAKKMLR